MRIHRGVLILCAAGASALGALGGAVSADAGTITVTNGADSGAGSLRAAIEAASAGETIVVPAETVSLTSGQLLINKNLSIVGAGARSTTITGGGHSRVFEISTGTVSISGVTVTGGNGMEKPGGSPGYGGGISVESPASVTLTDSAVTGNETTSSAEGGGIAVSGTMEILRSTISYNAAPAADRAGGIELASSGSSTFELSDSTIAHNTIEAGGLGAGLYANEWGTSLTLLNDTFDLDSAGPTGSVLDLNGGKNPATIENTIILGGSGESCSRIGSGHTDLNDLEDQALCGFPNATEQKVKQLLGPLQNNGGPTDTQSPAIGSPAIDAANDAGCPATDQRGVSRPQGAHCDIGAVELTTPTAGARRCRVSPPAERH